MATNKTRLESEKVPLSAGCSKHLVGIDTHAVENHGQLINEGDIDVALGVFDHFSGFGYFDG